ncbi:MAG TPA: FAD-dependent oxidoreductase [Beijerinckiaceae bacterium]|nr:FAD-dependent oxidoreductase [Beijerinckiaceae bacterium]
MSICKNSSSRSQEQNTKEVPRVAVIGGGPGGLFTAWHLASKVGNACEIVVFEATDRVGGKIVTKQFAGAGLYEAGVAEIYGYSHLGPDPLRDLITQDLDLDTQPISGDACVFDGEILPNVEALAERYGAAARDEAKAFRAKCGMLLNKAAFYKGERLADNAHPWAAISGEELLAREISDETARRYIRVMAHSDVAAAPHQTNGLNFLKNVLMDVDDYIDVYSVKGGNEQIVQRLVDELDAEIRINAPLRSLEALADGTYRLVVGTNGHRHEVDADYVVMALPLSAFSSIDFRSATLKRGMARHVQYYDRPAHYVRATLLFEWPFWRDHIDGEWWMADAFDGCCVYDESARHDYGRWGALGFLIGGNAALDVANMTDERIEELCLDSFPREMAYGKELLVDRRIHRWMASVNAIPGGYPMRRRSEAHRPDAANQPRVFVVGDYMFDATLNGVLDSADSATDLLLADLLASRRARQLKTAGVIGTCRWPLGFNEEVLGLYFGADFLAELMKVAYRLQPGARVLHVGSGSGVVVAALRARGFDAFGVEPNRLAHVGTPADVAPFNRLGRVTDLQCPDGHFDVILETVLCHLPRGDVAAVVAELRRAAGRGVILGSITTDQTIDLLEKFDLLSGVETLASRWEWADDLFAVGFDHALSDPLRLAEAWKRAQAAGAGPGHWYEDAESLLYCCYEIPIAHETSVGHEAQSAPSAELQDNGQKITAARSVIA